MAISYRQTDDNASCTAFATNEKLAIEGGTAGTTELTGDINGLSNNIQFYADEIEDDEATLDGGSITARLNITTAGMSVTWDRLQVFRLNSSCATEETLGDFDGLAIDCSTTGVKSTTQTISAASAHNAGDKIFLMYLFDNSFMNPVTIGITPDQDIDTPFAPVAGGAVIKDPIMRGMVVPFARSALLWLPGQLVGVLPGA